MNLIQKRSGKMLSRKSKKAEYDYMRFIEKVGEQPGYFWPYMPAIQRGFNEPFPVANGDFAPSRLDQIPFPPSLGALSSHLGA